MLFILSLSKYIMVVKYAHKEEETGVDRTQEIKKEFDRLDQFKINIVGTTLTLGLNEMKRNVRTFEHIRMTSAETHIHIFGKDGVGGITSDKVCVQVDGNKANVWIDNSLYALLPNKEDLRNPDELMKIPAFKIYTPIFKALSNCDIPITSVTASANIQEIEEKLKLDHEIISQLSKSIKMHGLEKVTDALARYTSNRIKPKTGLAADPLRIKFEVLLFEDLLSSELYDLQKVGAARVLEFPTGRKVRLNGLDGIGVLDANGLVVQIDKNETKIFVEDSAYFTIRRDILKDTTIPPQEICSRIIKNSELLQDELCHFSSILKVLSDSGMHVSEFSPKGADELQKIAEVLVEQVWIASQHKRQNKPLKEVLQEIVSHIGDAQRVNDAFARYGITDRVSAVPVKAKKEEIPEPPATPKVVSADHLTEALSECFKTMKKNMADEKFDGIEIVGLGNVKAINLHEDIVVTCKEKSAVVIVEEDLLSSALKHVQRSREEDLLDRLELLEGHTEFQELVTTIKALKKAGIKEFEITPYGHDADYYLNEVREICAPAAAFVEEMAEGKSIAETVSTLMKSTNIDVVVESLKKTGFSDEAREVSTYTAQAKITREKLNGMIREWVGNNAVPSKAELLKCAASLKLTENEFEATLNSALDGMRESYINSQKNVAYYEKRLQEPTLEDGFRTEFERFVKEGNRGIQESNARIEKIEKALRILRGA